MTMTNTTDYQLVALDPAAADVLRARGGIVYIADEKPGFPCRQCLRDAEIGEAMILVSHDPFEGTSPYRCASPIFLHRETCVRESADTLPEQLTGRRLSVRAFDADEMMVDAALIEGHDLAATIVDLLANADVQRLHIHNEPRGCYAASVHRR
jgi:hypothetical protein